jgi:hypothetical protein
MNITLQVNPYLPIIDTSGNADTTWYLFATLSNGAAVKVNFLQGHEAPELCMKAPNKVMLGGGSANPLEGDFESDAVMWRVRHILGGKQIDPRMSAAFTRVVQPSPDGPGSKTRAFSFHPRSAPWHSHT